MIGVRAADALGAGILLAASMVLLDGCAVYAKEVRSMPSLGPEAVVVHACPPEQGVSYSPRSGGRICFSVNGVDTEVEARNGETTALYVGPLIPVIPFGTGPRHPDRPLAIALFFKTDAGYSFHPWRVSVQTDQGETIGASKVYQNVREGSGVHTAQLDPRDQEARMLSGRFEIVFAKHVAPDQSFSLTLHLVAPDGSDLQLPRIAFQKGKLSYLGAIP